MRADRQKDRYSKRQQVAQWHEGRRAASIRGVLFRRRVPQPYFVLIVEPRLIERARAQVDDPTNETRLDRGFVSVVRPLIGPEEPARQMVLRADDRAPAIDQLL